MFINVSLKKLLMKKSTIIGLIILLFLILLIVFMISKINYLRYGKKIKLNDNEIVFDTYYAEYDMTVISNKNINTYSVKEWYKSSLGNCFEYLDYTGNVMSIITTKDICYIQNNNNKYKLTLNSIYGDSNISSLSTFKKIYKNTVCKCSKDTHVKDGEIIVCINLNSLCNCNECDALKDMKIEKLELILDRKNMKPNAYIVFGENKKEYISIVYRRFDVNLKIEDEKFNVKNNN